MAPFKNSGLGSGAKTSYFTKDSSILAGSSTVGKSEN